MTAWTSDALDGAGAAGELQVLAPARADFPTAAHILE
jgi:hypothetical protein